MKMKTKRDKTIRLLVYVVCRRLYRRLYRRRCHYRRRRRRLRRRFPSRLFLTRSAPVSN